MINNKNVLINTSTSNRAGDREGDQNVESDEDYEEEYHNTHDLRKGLSEKKSQTKTKEELKKEKKLKKLQALEDKKLAKIRKMEKKHWLQALSESLSRLFRKTIGFFTFEFKYFDDFPREDFEEFKQNTGGLLWGITLAYLLFFLLVFTFRRDPAIALYFCMVLMILSVFGISFSKDMRCVFCLVGPCLASSRLRWVLLMYASVLTGLGPALNMMRNSGNFRSSIVCVLDQVRLNFQIIKLIAKSPYQLIKYNLDKWRNAVRETWRSLKDAISIIKLGLFNSGSAVNNQINYFQTLLNICNDKLSLFNQCVIFFNNIYHNCRYTLKFFKDLCYMIRYIAAEACRVTESLGEMCDNAEMKLNNLNSTVAKKIMKKVDAAFEKLLRKIGQKETSLYTSEKASEELKLQGIEVTNISENLKEKAKKLEIMLNRVKDFFEVILIIWTLFAISFVFIQSAAFRRSWLHKDSFENTFITRPFLLLEKDAFENDKPMTLPLIGPEKLKYVTLDSNSWTKLEKVRASRGAGLILISSISLISTIILDYIVYIFVIIIVPTFEQSYQGDRNVDLNILVGGNSTVGSLVKSMFSVLGPLKDIATDIDLQVCKPIPNEPNYTVYVIIILIVFMTLTTLAFEVRILRTRHKIMISFYPARAIQRAIWLRTYIRNTRGSTKKFILVNISNKLRKKKTKNLSQNQLSFVGFLIAKSKFWAKFLKLIGKQRVFCVSCGSEGDPKNNEIFSRNFTQCVQCHSMFCKHCFQYFKNICIICHVPLYSEEIEIDLHKLSSDEDYDDFKSKYINITEKDIDTKDVPGYIG